MSHQEREYSRRHLILVATGGFTAGILGTAAFFSKNPNVITPPQPPTADTAKSIAPELTSPEIVHIPESVLPFDDKDANEVALAKGITVGSFFKFNFATLSGLSAFNNQELYPIYPPAVMYQKERIYRISRELKVSPNNIATLMSIESAGLEQAGSGVGAQGLMQVMPLHFDPSIQNNPQAMRNPDLNIQVGTKFFANECIPAARKYVGGKAEGHVNIYAKAAICYNGGQSMAPLNFEALPEESKFYGDHFVRFALTAEVADGLRKKGFSDREIVQKLSSSKVNARAQALEHFVDLYPQHSYDLYEQALIELNKIVPGETQGEIPTKLAREINSAYKKALEKSNYKVPLSPGARIWSSYGGISLLSTAPINLNPEAWYKMDSTYKPAA